jgi:hypothetical protein
VLAPPILGGLHHGRRANMSWFRDFGVVMSTSDRLTSSFNPSSGIVRGVQSSLEGLTGRADAMTYRTLC